MDLSNLYVILSFFGVIILGGALAAAAAFGVSTFDNERILSEKPVEESKYDAPKQHFLIRVGRQLLKLPVIVAILAFTIGLVIAGFYSAGVIPNFRVFPEVATAEAAKVDRLWYNMFGVSMVVLLLVELLVIFVPIYFRRRKGDEGMGATFSHHTGMELGWTIVPTITVFAIGFASFSLLNEIETAPADSIEINLTAQQFSWTFEYPEFGEAITSDLYIPVDQAVTLNIQSRDVLHAFWVPEFRIKQDAVPGEINTIYFTPDKVGDWRIVCAELCGTGHGQMGLEWRVYVLSAEDYDAWLVENTGQTLDEWENPAPAEEEPVEGEAAEAAAEG